MIRRRVVVVGDPDRLDADCGEVVDERELERDDPLRRPLDRDRAERPVDRARRRARRAAGRVELLRLRLRRRARRRAGVTPARRRARSRATAPIRFFTTAPFVVPSTESSRRRLPRPPTWAARAGAPAPRHARRRPGARRPSPRTPRASTRSAAAIRGPRPAFGAPNQSRSCTRSNQVQIFSNSIRISSASSYV